MKNFNFEEVSEQLRKEIVKLVNRKNELRAVRDSLESDLRAITDLCVTYGADTSQSRTYMHAFNRLVKTESEIAIASAKIAEYGSLRDDIDNVAARYNSLSTCCGQCQICASTETPKDSSEYDDMVMSLLEALFCSDFNGAVINCVRLTPPHFS